MFDMRDKTGLPEGPLVGTGINGVVICPRIIGGFVGLSPGVAN